MKPTIYTAVAANYATYAVQVLGAFATLAEALASFDHEGALHRAHERVVRVAKLGTCFVSAKCLWVEQLSQRGSKTEVGVLAFEGTQEYEDERLRHEMGLSS